MSITSQTVTRGVQPHYLNRLVEIDAEETPIFSLIEKGAPLKNPIAQEPFDDKETASKEGRLDGDDAPSASKADNYRIISSQNHLLEETIRVGKKAQNLTDQAGIGLKGQFKRQLEKKMKAQKTAADQIFGDDEDERAEGTGGKGSETRGGLLWCSNSAQGTNPVDELYRTPSAQISAVPVDEFTEIAFQNMINEHHDTTGRSGKFTAVAGIGIKQRISNWSILADATATQNYIRRFEGDVSKESKVLNAMVNVLECDGGMVELHKTRNLRWDRRTGERHAYSKYTLFGWHQGCLKLREGWSPGYEELGKRGNAKEGMIDMCFALTADPTGLIKYVPTAMS